MELLNGLPGWAEKLIEAFIAPLRAPLDQGTLLHWPFLVCALGIALLVFYLQPGRKTRRPNLAEFARKYFNAGIWWHASARADYRYYIVNGALFPIVFAPFFAVSALTATALAGWLGAPEASAAADREIGWAAIALLSLLVFIAYDFGHYVGHWAQHTNSWLWEFHKIHHSAQVLTPITSFRLHPVDLLLMSVPPGFCTGIVLGVAQGLAGGAIGGYTILGMSAGTALYHVISNLRHSHVWVSYGPTVEHWLVSPAQHQIHHSIEQKHFHKNMGRAFAIWDRMFGTLYVPEGEEDIVYGLGDGTETDYHGVGRMYVMPFVRIFERLRAGG